MYLIFASVFTQDMQQKEDKYCDNARQVSVQVILHFGCVMNKLMQGGFHELGEGGKSLWTP